MTSVLDLSRAKSLLDAKHPTLGGALPEADVSAHACLPFLLKVKPGLCRFAEAAAGVSGLHANVGEAAHDLVGSRAAPPLLDG